MVIHPLQSVKSNWSLQQERKASFTLTSRLSLLSNTTAVDFNVMNQFKSDYGGEYIKQVDEVNDESVLIN